MSRSAPILFGEPQFDESEVDAVTRVMRSGWIGQGPLVDEFERRLAEYVGNEHVVSVSSCTAALSLSLVACGVGPGDEVITTPFTFIATINAIEHVGATPVLVDIDPVSLNITASAVAGRITERTRAIMPVHFAGWPIETDALVELCERHDLWLIEDAAHALGGVSGARRVGGHPSPRVATCFSFYPNKNVASAEGGAVATSNAEIAERLARLRIHGLDSDAWKRFRDLRSVASLAVVPGYKANWTDLQAAIALCQLEKIEGFLAVREQIADEFDAAFAEVDGVAVRPRPTMSLTERHALHLYQVEILGPEGRRDEVLAETRARGIGTAIHYIGVNQHPYYLDRLTDAVPISDQASWRLLTLPSHPGLSASDVERVVDVVSSSAAPAAR